jgi:hypothetical protein
MIVVGFTSQSLFDETMAMDFTHDLEHPTIRDPSGDQMVFDHPVPGQSVIVAHYFSLWVWIRKILNRGATFFSTSIT